MAVDKNRLFDYVFETLERRYDTSELKRKLSLGETLEIPYANDPDIWDIKDKILRYKLTSPSLYEILYTSVEYDLFEKLNIFFALNDGLTDENEETAKIDSIESIIIDTGNKIKDILFEIFLHNEKLYEISSREFEKVIAELLYFNGFEVELSKQTRDGGYDIIALKRMDNLNPIKYLVECKRFGPTRRIGVEIIRSFKEVIQTEQANKGLIVTTSYFSSDAIKKQLETPYLLDYKDKDDLMKWVKEYFNSNKTKR